MIYINCVVYIYACLYVCKYISLSIFAYIIIYYGSRTLQRFFLNSSAPSNLLLMCSSKKSHSTGHRTPPGIP